MDFPFFYFTNGIYQNLEFFQALTNSIIDITVPVIPDTYLPGL